MTSVSLLFRPFLAWMEKPKSINFSSSEPELEEPAHAESLFWTSAFFAFVGHTWRCRGSYKWNYKLGDYGYNYGPGTYKSTYQYPCTSKYLWAPYSLVPQIQRCCIILGFGAKKEYRATGGLHWATVVHPS